MPQEENRLNSPEKTTIKVSQKPSLAAGKVKRGRPRKKPLAKGKARPAAKAKKKKKASVGAFLTVAALTAVLVGGGMYMWFQAKSKEIKIEAAWQKQSLEEEMQQQIKVLKNRLEALKKEKESLNQEKQALSAKADKLSQAQLTFISNDLGLTFFYPAVFGDLAATTSQGQAGSFWQGQFSENDNLSLAAVTADYLPAGTSSEFKIVDFFQKDKKYFLRLIGPEKKEIEVKPDKVLKLAGQEVLLLTANSLPADWRQQVLGPAKLIAVEILPAKKYASLVWQVKDDKQLPMDKLGQILETVRFF